MALTIPAVPGNAGQAGWPGRVAPEVVAARGAPALPTTVAGCLVRLLAELGVEEAFGLTGGAIVPLCDALGRSEIRVRHFRHETGAGFAATEASLATGKPVVIFATTGPGITNALTGLSAARWEGAKVILVSGSTAPAHRGRWACQETSSFTSPVAELFTAGRIFHHAATLEDAAELPELAARLAHGLLRPGGFVAHVNVPISVQALRVPVELHVPHPTVELGGPSDEVATHHARLFSEEPFVIWAGFGARHSAALLRALAERTGAHVMCSPRAKGVFPEEHPLSLGITGIAGYGPFERQLAEHRPAYTLVLGSRLGEYTSLWDPVVIPSRAFVHVDLDPEVPGAAFPAVPVLAVQAEIGAYLSALLDKLPQLRRVARSAPPVEVRAVPEAVPEGRIRPSELLAAIQRVVVDGSETPVLADAGNSFAWGNHLLRFPAPRYRVSMGFGSMGHAVAGVVGVALATGRKAVALVGDGAMLMQNELSTAVAYRAPAVWIVLNDAQYGMVEQGMTALGFPPVETAIPRVDFVAFARAQGGDGIRVELREQLVPALEAALLARGPFVVDVLIDPTEAAPFLNRVRSLQRQGVAAKGGSR